MKTCRKCGEEKPLEDFPVYRDTRRATTRTPRRVRAELRTTADGRRGVCRKCWRRLPSKLGEARQAERRQAAERAGRTYRTRDEALTASVQRAQEKRTLSELAREKREAELAQRRVIADNLERDRARRYEGQRRGTDKVRARRLLQRAVAAGRITKPDRCSRCSRETSKRILHGHHENYSRLYDVTWLCPLCHAAVDPEYGAARAKIRAIKVLP